MKTILALCLAVAVLAGCGGSDQPPVPASELYDEAGVTELDREAPEHEGLFPAQDPKTSAERGHPVIPVDDQAEARQALRTRAAVAAVRAR